MAAMYMPAHRPGELRITHEENKRDTSSGRKPVLVFYFDTGNLSMQRAKERLQAFEARIKGLSGLSTDYHIIILPGSETRVELLSEMGVERKVHERNSEENLYSAIDDIL